MIKKIVIAVFAVLLLLSSHYATYHYSKDVGKIEGIRAYHSQCFEVGGYIISDTGQVVVCQGQGSIPKEELKNFKSTI